MLRDPYKRALYDEELRREAWASDVSISETLPLGNLQQHRTAADEMAFSYDCRCGGSFVLEAAAVTEQPMHESVLVPCNTCSLCIEVLL